MEKRKYYIWGTGKIAKQMNREYGYILGRLEIKGYIDNNKILWGKEFEGKKIYSPNVLREEKEAYLIIANVYKDEIIQQIQNDMLYDLGRIEENFLQKLQIMDRYRNSAEIEQRNIVGYLGNHSLQVFNYSFTDKYSDMKCEIEFDSERGLFYALHNGKRMYFARYFNTMETAGQYYRWLCMEQDMESPHRYVSDNGTLGDDLTILDAGAAEGNFSLSLIERAKKVYLFESDKDWVEALRYTFEPYRDKVVIIQKNLSNYENVVTTTIDKELVGEIIDILKMDVEGEEIYALKGGIKTIENSPDIRCYVCSYHQEFAYDVIKTFFEQRKFEVDSSSGYMWFPENPSSPRTSILRKGIVRASSIVVHKK